MVEYQYLMTIRHKKRKSFHNCIHAWKDLPLCAEHIRLGYVNRFVRFIPLMNYYRGL